LQKGELGIGQVIKDDIISLAHLKPENPFHEIKL
jgi:hypothetical protein